MKEYIPLMSEHILGERLHADEATTTIALNQALPFQFGREYYDDEEFSSWSKSIIRTGAIYVVEAEQMVPDWDMIRDMPMDLPPLPFPRLVIEGELDKKPIGFSWKTELPPYTEIMCLNLIIILEVEKGRKWDVSFAIEYGGNDHFFLYEIENRDGKLVMVFPNRLAEIVGVGQDDLSRVSETFAKYAIQCVHLITARNTPIHKLDLPRAQRRNFLRKFKIEHPVVYRVKLAQAGDLEGTSGWHYKVRFLVCGHWRHYSNGVRTWVRPYIKGPVGAPWKGRPVHEKD